MDLYRQTETSMSAQVELAVAFGNEDYPKDHRFENDSVQSIFHAYPGIIEVRAKKPRHDKMVIVGGMHGNEKAGIMILDRLIEKIRIGELPVTRDLLLIYGNPASMRAEGGAGVRAIEIEHGPTANLNRCFGGDAFAEPQCYAERRANQIMVVVERFAGKRTEKLEVIDIHQSFSVPTLEQVRDGARDRSDYTYAMLYPAGLDDTLTWLYNEYSDIVAGAVVSDDTLEHHTFAGFMAREYGARAVTLEQGEIGCVDVNTFTPQLGDNLERKIRGEIELVHKEGFDLWQVKREIVKTAADFTFLDVRGRRAKTPPVDFLPVHDEAIAKCDGEEIWLEDDERLLFANPDVPIGDRAAVVIVRSQTDVIPKPE